MNLSIQRKGKLMASWRERAQPVIAAVLAETAGQSEKVIRKALRDAFPFGPMEYHPYKIWLDEIKAQRGLKKLKPKVIEPPDPRQPEMF